MSDATSTAERLLASSAFALATSEKRAALLPTLEELTRKHHRDCEIYRRLVDRVFGGLPKETYARIEDVPFIPVSLFKQFELRSIPSADIFRVLTSSGTTGQAVSRVILDRETAALQGKALVKIMQHFIG